jgi:hypothetical protein
MGHFIENFFQLGSGGSQKNDVTGGSVHVGNTAAAKIPQVTELPKIFGRIELSTGLVYPHGMEMRHARERLRLVAIATDNTAALTEYADDSAVLPMGAAVLERKFQNAQEVLHNILGNLEFNIRFVFCPHFGLLLEIRHKARPWPAFKLVQQRGFVFCHYLPPFYYFLPLKTAIMN